MLPFEHARPTAIMTWMRQHCGIENSLHWIRDVTFDQSELTRWGEMTSATFEVVAMPGGHFFARTAAALLSWLAEDFRRVLGFSR